MFSSHDSLRRVSLRLSLVVCVAAALLGLAQHAAAQNYAYKADVGYTQLQAELGGALPTGLGQRFMLVEATVSGGYYMPDTTLGDFTGKTINNVTGGTSTASWHATTVARLGFGSTYSMAPAANPIDVYEANNWLSSYLKVGGAAPLQPASGQRVASHSWVGSYGNNTSDVNALRRMDYIVNTDDFIQVVSVNNPGNPVQNLLAGSFNTIAVGITLGTAASGTNALASPYAAGRAKPDIVAPQNFTSWAAPTVAAAAAMLVETGHNNPLLSNGSYASPRTGATIYHAETSETIKAILMAGADRTTNNASATYGQIVDYGNPTYATTNGLDTRYGSGQLNVYNSYHIMAAGEQEPGVIDLMGFDYNPSFAAASSAIYSFTGATAATASLVWNAAVTLSGNPNSLTSSATLADFNLALYQVTGMGDVLMTQSISTIDNTENIFLTGLSQDETYKFVVSRADALGNWDYALAWNLQAVPEPATGLLMLMAIAILAMRYRRRYGA
jgi:hypothetical protein